MKNVFVLMITSPGGTHAEGVFDSEKDVFDYIVSKNWSTHDYLTNHRYQALKNINMGAHISKSSYHQSRVDKIDHLLKN